MRYLAKTGIIPKTQTAQFMIFSGMMLFVLSSIVVGLFLNRLKIHEATETAPTRRIQDLVTLLNQAEKKQTALETEVVQLRKVKANRPVSNSPEPDALELSKLSQLAGLTPVTGHGIQMRIENSTVKPAANDAHSDPEAGKLQASDLLNLVNDIKAAGAQAISINDQRIIVSTEIVAAGPTIVINQNRLREPIVIKAIGDPTVLTNALKIRGGTLETLDFFRIKITLQSLDRLTVPAYHGSLPQ